MFMHARMCYTSVPLAASSCIYVYNIYKYIYIYIYVYIYISIQIYIYQYIYVYLYIYIHTCMSIYIHIYMYILVYMCILHEFVNMFIDNFMCTYVYCTGVPLAACLGDQQSAIVGHAAFNKGDSKNTYGTGLQIHMHTCVYICINMYINMCMCIYIFMCM